MGCQKGIAAQIVAKGADYVLALKGNHSGVLEDIQELFAYAADTDFANCDYHQTVEKDHDRLEIRECWTTSEPDYFPFCAMPQPGLTCAPWLWFALNATKRIRSQLKSVTSCPAWKIRPTNSCTPCAPIGRLKIKCIGS
jgi:hypothetical protein